MSHPITHTPPPGRPAHRQQQQQHQLHQTNNQQQQHSQHSTQQVHSSRSSLSFSTSHSHSLSSSSSSHGQNFNAYRSAGGNSSIGASAGSNSSVGAMTGSAGVSTSSSNGSLARRTPLKAMTRMRQPNEMVPAMPNIETIFASHISSSTSSSGDMMLLSGSESTLQSPVKLLGGSPLRISGHETHASSSIFPDSPQEVIHGRRISAEQLRISQAMNNANDTGTVRHKSKRFDLTDISTAISDAQEAPAASTLMSMFAEHGTTHNPVLRPRKSTPVLLNTKSATVAASTASYQLPRSKIPLGPSKLPHLKEKSSPLPIASTSTLDAFGSSRTLSASCHPAPAPESQLATSFDECTANLRHRHRTLSVSESEIDTQEAHNIDTDNEDNGGLPNKARKEDRTANPSSPTTELTRRTSSGKASLAGSKRSSLALGGAVHHHRHRFSIDEKSPFLDTPARSRGVTANPALGHAIHASVASSNTTLKSSRMSYPPKSLNFTANNNPLFASVPASSQGGTPRPMDQMFLSSILGPQTAGLARDVSNTAAPLARQRSLTKQPHHLDLSDSMAMSPQAGRKRTANGRFAPSSTAASASSAASSVAMSRNSTNGTSNGSGFSLQSRTTADSSAFDGHALNRSTGLSSAMHKFAIHAGLPSSDSLANIAGQWAANVTPSALDDDEDDRMQIDDDDVQEHARKSSLPGRVSEDGAASTEDGYTASHRVPSLTSSSSVTSSLASSHRSDRLDSNASTPIAENGYRKTHTIDCGDNSFDDANRLVDASFVSTASSTDFNPLDRSRTDDIRRTSSSANQLFAAGGVDANTVPSPARSPRVPIKQTTRVSPQLRNIKPNQAIFHDAGLQTKKSRAKAERDSGVGMNSSSSIWKNLLSKNSNAGTGSANSSFFSGVGNSSLSNSIGASTAPLSTPMSTRKENSFFASPMVNIEMANAGSPAIVAHLANISAPIGPMPNTPCKKPAFAGLGARLAAAKDGTHQLHPLAQSSKPVTMRSTSSNSTSSEGSSVINSIPGSAIKPSRSSIFMNSPSPKILVKTFGRKSPVNSPGSAVETSVETSVSPSSNGSPLSSIARLGSFVGAKAKRPPPLRRIGGPLFRRRSSGQLFLEGSSTPAAEGQKPDWEPMTPTRTAGNQPWLNVPHLAVSPQPSPELHISAVPASSPSASSDAAMISPTSPLAHGLPSFAQRLASSNNAHAASAPRAPLAHIRPPQRPAFRIRHSSSTVQTLRQNEINSPDRFSTCFHIVRTLGQGEYSEAYEVEDRTTGRVSAVKKTKRPFTGAKDRLRQLEEVDILRLLSKETNDADSHILRFNDAWEQSGNLYIQTELCAYGNLANFLEEYGCEYEFLEEARVWKILSELASGLAHIHANGVLHLDIKPANIFITASGGLKIGDFGLATRWPRASPVAILSGAALDSPPESARIWSTERMRAKSSEPVASPGSDLEREGDRGYIAPEILRGQYGKAADLFSLGLVILEAATNVVLPANGLAWRKLRENDFSDVEMGRLSDELVNVIAHLLDAEPTTRTTVTELCAHPILSKLATLRAVGQQLEDDGQDLSNPDLPMCARGAVIDESPSFLSDILSEVRYAYHSPGRQRTLSVPSSSLDMDVDEA